ncbi:unnamed protein product [Rangifer tarandus platyrhynchus]|uniref:Uncharacterized protein n=1 Tax=Rangifer tarandus platyrhynchus TaxID=3082113 RepID=A0ABN8ZTS0_RANTA|nr:unnamed protein product [Rangifer tarandus platyrhynchus]
MPLSTPLPADLNEVLGSPALESAQRTRVPRASSTITAATGAAQSDGAERNLASGSRGAATPHRQPAQLSAPGKTGRLGDVTDGVPGSS